MPHKAATDKNDLTPIQRKVLNTAVSIYQDTPGSDDIAFMPAGLCHTFFPYTDPGKDVDTWFRKQGNFVLSIEASKEYNPHTEQMERLGLPSGAKPRLLLAVLNTLALKSNSPEMNLGNSLTEFVGEFMKLNTDGRTINEVKSQMAKLASADIKITYNEGAGHAYRDRLNIIRGLDVWWAKDKNQRHLWGNYLRFSDDYFNSIKEHSVPLDMRALRALSNKPMAIDVYSFMAHRLHSLSKPTTVTWQAIKDQFGYTYSAMNYFKRDFRKILSLVKSLYPDARFDEIENRGFILYPSKPPIAPKTQMIVPIIHTPDNPFANHPKRRKGRTPSKAEMKEIQKELDLFREQQTAKMTPAQKEQQAAVTAKIIGSRK